MSWPIETIFSKTASNVFNPLYTQEKFVLKEKSRD